MIANAKLEKYILRFQDEYDIITDGRKNKLGRIAESIHGKLVHDGHCDVMAICTHNSRRSQLVEYWMALGALHFGIDGLKSWSGGSEETSFNARMVYALQYIGSDFYRYKDGPNPHYKTADIRDNIFFSKKYDDTYNPDKGFMALMVCDDADKNCPFVPGASPRFSLYYKDPKMYDDTPEELSGYLGKVNEIGREIWYLLTLVKQSSL